jgi:hypothetical protein
MDSIQLPARRAARLALVVLAVALLAGVALESGQAPIEHALRAHGPRIALAAVPLLYISLALRRGPSRGALALGVAYPVALLASFAQGMISKYQSGTEGAMEVMFSFLFFWFSASWALFLLAFLPLMMRLALVSWRAYRARYGFRVAPVVAWGAAVTGAIVAVRAPLGAAVRDVPQYGPAVVDNALEPLNECIWRAAGPGAEAGFPSRLEEIRHVRYRVYPTSASKPRNECAEQLDRIPEHPFDVVYERDGHDGFTLTLTEKTRPGGRPKVVWIDHAGLRREGVAGRRAVADSVRLVSTSALRTFLIVQHLIEDYATRHGGEYPERLIADFRVAEGAAPPAGALPAEVGECDADDPAASCVEKWERALVYVPVRDASGRVGGYTLTMRPVSYYDYERQQPVPSRTHHRDASGALHSFGGFRAANATDPPPADDEIASARTALAQYVSDRERAARR